MKPVVPCPPLVVHRLSTSLFVPLTPWIPVVDVGSINAEYEQLDQEPVDSEPEDVVPPPLKP